MLPARGSDDDARLYRKRNGREPASIAALHRWVKREWPADLQIEPTDADFRAVEREYPDLAAQARRQGANRA